MIRAESLSRSYETGRQPVVAVNDLNLAVRTGERISIVGRSGSGKSTLLNLLAGLDRPTAGTLTVDSCALHALNRAQMAEYRLRTTGVVFQSFQLIPQRTALQNVELPLIIGRVPKAERQKRAESALDRVGLNGRMTHFPYELSGGEQQRVAIARSVIYQPKVLLADEPTGNLDSSTADDIEQLILQLCRESALTFVLVTHDEALAARMGHRKLRMADGTLTEESCG